MILADCEIAREIAYGELDITPYHEAHVQPASYDLTLGTEFVEYPQMTPYQIIDPDQGMGEAGNVVEADSYVLAPGEFVLATTEEAVSLPPTISGEVKGRSSIGRLGVIPHTAGWVDPGFTGTITLEFVNHNDNPVVLRAGMRCCQIVFQRCGRAASSPYGEKADSKYQGQQGAVQSRIEDDVDWTEGTG